MKMYWELKKISGINRKEVKIYNEGDGSESESSHYGEESYMISIQKASKKNDI